MDRYHRQSLVPQIGAAGQARLRAARVVVVGVGALGSMVAEQLARAGVGLLRVVDRDVVELTNLQRQVLYDEADARRGVPKVEAAARRLASINVDVRVEPHAVDVDAGNVEALVRDVDVILDGSDNAELRYLVNDASVKHAVPWVMGGAIGVEGRVAAFRPGGACLRCVFPTPPAAGELATCDTAGALAPAVAIVASVQVVEAMKLLVGDPAAASRLHTIDAWSGRHRAIDLAEARRADCPCCVGRRFEFLDAVRSAGARLCGRDAVQVRPAAGRGVDLAALADRLAPVATLDASALMLKVVMHERPELALSVFGDGRMIVNGTRDPGVARSMYARVVGA